MVCCWGVYQHLKVSSKGVLFGFIAVGLLFNPLIPFRFNKDLWQIVDILGGIALIGIAISVVCFYNMKTYTFNWRKIMFVFIKLIIATAVILGIAIFSFIKIQEFKDKKEGQLIRSTRCDELGGIKLGNSVADVLYKMGKPSKSSKFMYEYFIEQYGYNNSYFIEVYFNTIDGKVVAIGTTEKRDYETARILSLLYKKPTEDELINMLGKPKTILYSQDGLSRLFEYPKNYVWAILEKGSIVGFGVYNPSEHLDFLDADFSLGFTLSPPTIHPL